MDLKTQKILVESIAKTQDSKIAPYTTTGVVTSVSDDIIYVRLQGSDNSTPIKKTSVSVKMGDTVDVSVSHSDTHITGNRSDVAMNATTTNDISKQYAEEVKDEINLKYAKIQDLDVANANIENLKANKAEIDDLKAINADVDNLKAKDLEITNLVANKAEIKDLDAANANIEYLKAHSADIDFSNIGTAAIEKIFSDTGLIKNLVVGDQTITGNLVGVTINGDLIEGNTIKADKLVVLGSDGLYYKLNVNGSSIEQEQTDYNSLNGSNIQAKSITASKIAVDDLVAFGATIGGFHITNKSIYSGVKNNIDDKTHGVYLDSDGQIAIGDSNNYVKFYKNQNGEYKLAIAAEEITMGSVSGKTLEDELRDMNEKMETMKDEITTNLVIESSRGTVFKNNSVSTVLSVVIYRGSERIIDIDHLHSSMGDNTYLQWKWQRLNEDSFGIISSSDSRIGNDGFTFTLSPEDVDTKVTFMCELISS